MAASLLEMVMAEKVEDFNQRRGRYSAPDFEGQSLAGLTLQEINFSKVNLENADLTGTDLSESLMMMTQLYGADLSKATLRGVEGRQSRWRGAYLEGTCLDVADLTQADMRETDLEGVSAKQVRLQGARISASFLSDCDFSEGWLEEAKLHGSELTSCRFQQAILTRAGMREAQFEGCTLDDADMRECRAERASFQQCSMKKVRLRGANLRGADFSGSDLSGSDLSRCDLTEANFEGATLEGASFSECLMSPELEASLQDRGASMSSAEFSTLPAQVHFEAPSALVSGGVLAVLWENIEDSKSSAIRVALRPLDEESPEPCMPALSSPAALVIAKVLCPHPEGFLAFLILERPGGASLEVTGIAPDGQFFYSEAIAMMHSPKVAPIIRHEGEGIYRIQSLEEGGNGLRTLRYQRGSLEDLGSSSVRGGRGFVGGLAPLLITRGGLMKPLELSGLLDGEPCPSGFPSRMNAAHHHEGQTALAWSHPDQKGISWYSAGQQGTTMRERKALALDVTFVDGEPLILATWAEREGHVGVHLVRGDGSSQPLLVDELLDIEEMSVIAGDDERTYILCSTLREDLLLLGMIDETCRILAHLH